PLDRISVSPVSERPGSMIWPGRNLALAALVPALMSLTLLVSNELRPALIALDLTVAALAVLDLCSLVGARQFRVARACGAVASLDEPHRVELTLTNEGRRARSLRLRDDVPETFSATPGEFFVRVPGRGEVVLESILVPKRRGTYTLAR